MTSGKLGPLRHLQCPSDCVLVLPEEVPRCVLCGLKRPCFHHDRESVEKASLARSQSKIDSTIAPVSQSTCKPNAALCEAFAAAGKCPRLEWYGECPYHHPEVKQKSTTAVERCDICTVPLPCPRHFLMKESKSSRHLSPSKFSLSTRSELAAAALSEMPSISIEDSQGLLFAGWQVQSGSSDPSLRDASRLLAGSADEGFPRYNNNK